jgi:hypothetical protein
LLCPRPTAFPILHLALQQQMKKLRKYHVSRSVGFSSAF